MLGTIDPRLIETSPQTPVVYRGRDNVVQTAFTRYDGRKFVALDFASITRMVLILPTPSGGQMVFDSVATAGVIDWGLGYGRVVFDLTPYALPIGVYEGQLVVFDTEHPGGQVIVDGQDRARLVLDVREVYTAGTMPPPLPTGGESVVRRAGETLSALRGVYELAGLVYALDFEDSVHIDLFLGITVSAALIGADVIIQRSGTIDDLSWSWTVNQVYLGVAGALTQTVPTTGWEMVLGASPSPQRLNLNFDEPVLLAQEQ